MRPLLVLSLAAVLAVMLDGSPARAQKAEVWREPGFRVEWTADPPSRQRVTISGYVYNERNDMVRYVQIRIQELDSSGAVIAQRYHTVVGDILPGGRAFFTGWAPAGGAQYRISIGSFQQLGGGAS